MATRPSSIRIPDEVRLAIEAACRRTGLDFSSVANEMLAEAVKMRRIPGVVFAEGALGRVARVAGTGVEVFEIVRASREVGESWARLREAYHWLAESPLRAALAYAAAHRNEVEARLAADERSAAEDVRREYPFTAPRPPR